jgi:FkbM family methyltransferase
VFGSARARLARRILRLGLLARAADQHTGPVPDLSGTESVDTEWGPLYLDARDEVILPALRERGVWEPGETALLRQHLGPGMTFLDIGAHVGYYTVMAARLVEPGGLVMAFEPSPRNYELLLANVWRNGLGNVLCHPWAVGDANGFVDLYLDERNTGDNRIYRSSEDRPRTRVRMVALDSLSSLRPPIDAVKIDVQGPEDAVVRGMSRLLQGSPNAFITLEYWPYGLRALGRDERDTLRFYRSLGYRVRVQNPEEPGVDEMSDDEIMAYCSAQDGQLHTNLVLTRDADRRG